MIRGKLAAGQVPPRQNCRRRRAHALQRAPRRGVALVFMAVALLAVSVREWLLVLRQPRTGRAARGAVRGEREGGGGGLSVLIGNSWYASVVAWV